MLCMISWKFLDSAKTLVSVVNLSRIVRGVRLCQVRSRGGAEDALEASLATLARAGSGSGSGRSSAGGGVVPPILASVQPLAKLSQLR